MTPFPRPIRAALEAGTLEALIDARCLKELTYVLDYPQFVRFAVDKAEALETVARLSRLVDSNRYPKTHRRCRNAATATTRSFSNWRMQARRDWLVSKDRALLKLAKRTARDFGFRIAQPAPFVTSFKREV